jgi:hypothetical protein
VASGSAMVGSRACTEGRSFWWKVGGRTRATTMAAPYSEATMRPAWGDHQPSAGDAFPRGGGSTAGVVASRDGGSASGGRHPAMEVDSDLRRCSSWWGRSAAACGAALAVSWFPAARGRVWWPPTPGGRSHEWRRWWSGFSDLRHGRCKCSGVFFGRIYPLVDIEAGF